MHEDSKATILDPQNIASVTSFVKSGILLSRQPCYPDRPGAGGSVRVFLNSIDVRFRRPELDVQVQILAKAADSHRRAIAFLEAVQHGSPVLTGDLRPADREKNIALLQATALSR